MLWARLPPPVDHSEEVACALQAARALPEEQLQAEGRALLAAWRARPRHRRIPGVHALATLHPPSPLSNTLYLLPQTSSSGSCGL